MAFLQVAILTSGYWKLNPPQSLGTLAPPVLAGSQRRLSLHCSDRRPLRMSLVIQSHGPSFVH